VEVSMAEENIYAPPKTIIDPKERDKTTYLEHDGYSERGMLLCNEHFMPPSVCLKTGDAIDPDKQPVSRCVSRYLPSFRESAKVKKAWLARAILLLTFPLFMKNLFFILLFLSIFLIAHRLLQFFSAEKIIINVHVNESALKKKKIIILLFAIAAVVSAIFYVYQLINFSTKETLIISVATLLLTTRFAISSSVLLKFIRKKGDFYYLSGAHPYFLAALPLRSLDA